MTDAGLLRENGRLRAQNDAMKKDMHDVVLALVDSSNAIRDVLDDVDDVIEQVLLLYGLPPELTSVNDNVVEFPKGPQ